MSHGTRKTPDGKTWENKTGQKKARTTKENPSPSRNPNMRLDGSPHADNGISDCERSEKIFAFWASLAERSSGRGRLIGDTGSGGWVARPWAP